MKFLMIVASLIALLAAAHANATVVEPGQTIHLPNLTDGVDNETIPTANIVVQDSRSIDLVYNAPAGQFFTDGSTSVSSRVDFQSWVVRDPATQQLGFVYDLTDPDEAAPFLGSEGGNVTASSFTGFQTDVLREFNRETDISRTADGAAVRYDIPGNGEVGAPAIAVLTDATEFDSNGTLTFRLANEFTLVDSEGQNGQFVILGADGSLSGTFQPISGSEPPPSAIPLPPAVWTGMFTLLTAAGTIRHLRRA